MPTITELGQKVKAKFPGQYDDLSDIEVGQKVKEKYPTEYADFTEESVGLFKKIRERGRASNQTHSDFGAGIGKGILSTIEGASSLGEKTVKSIGRLVTPKSLEKKFGFQKEELTSAEKIIPESARTPETPGEKVGFAVEQIAEFLLPSSKIAKLQKGEPLLRRAAIEAATVGGQTAIQEGGIDSKAKTAAIVGGLFPVVGAGFGKGRQLLKPVGEKIQTTVIRPTAKDIKDGFKIQNIDKYNLGGSTEEVVTKTHVAINDLVKQLQNILQDGDNTVDLKNVVKRTQDRLLKDKASDFGNIKAIRRVVQSLNDEVAEVSEDGIVDLVQATNVKRGAGTKGAWAFGRVEPDANAVETVYTTFYDEIKNEIERQAPEGVREINKQISDLIPISNAALRRLPVEQRNNVISLTDGIGLFSAMFDPRALALIGANRLSKSGKFGQYLINLSKKQPKTSVGKRFLGN